MAAKALPPRKKSCSTCSKAKVRCDLQRPFCSRCRHRNLDCAYVGTNIADEYLSPVSVQDQEKDGVPNTLQTCQPPFESRSNSVTELADLDFDHIELISAVDEHRIRARWLESLLPSIDQRPKTFAASTMKFVWQVFKSYPAMFVGEDSSPPFIHWAQMKVVRCELLVNCVNVSHMWANKAAGTGNMVIEIIERQMTRLFDQVRFPDPRYSPAPVNDESKAGEIQPT